MVVVVAGDGGYGGVGELWLVPATVVLVTGGWAEFTLVINAELRGCH